MYNALLLPFLLQYIYLILIIRRFTFQCIVYMPKPLGHLLTRNEVAADPRVWNSLPVHIHQPVCLDTRIILPVIEDAFLLRLQRLVTD